MNVDYEKTYSEKLRLLRDENDESRAMELLVGGNFSAQGILEKSLLVGLGLRSQDCIVDIGCGSGRLAFALREEHKGRYVGTDIVPDALRYAETKVARDDWDFIPTTEAVIPLEDGQADFVCFFSVFTHLQDEDCYRFLLEARRVAKPNSLIIFSFLDFNVPCHWPVFENSIKEKGKNNVLNRFHARSTIEAWAEALDLNLERILDGGEPNVKLVEPIVFDDGRLQNGVVEFGQSVCVLRVSSRGLTTLPSSVEDERGSSIVVADGVLYNSSVRGTIGGNNSPMLAGFAINGNPRRILVRGIGPTLRRFGVENACESPQFELCSADKTMSFKSAAYNTLSDARSLFARTFAEVGAFQLEPNARDAVLIVTLPMGTYDVKLTGGGSAGMSLLEIYMLPSARFSPEQIGTSFPHIVGKDV